MRDDHPDYPALLVAVDILGGGALVSRLGNRVRQKEGLSYGVGAGLHAHAVDERAVFALSAIAGPENKEKLLRVVREEIDLMLMNGVTEKELDDAKQGILQERTMDRTEEGNLARLLAHHLFVDRSMQDLDEQEQKIASLTVSDVNESFRKHVVPERLVFACAGDFAGGQLKTASDGG